MPRINLINSKSVFFSTLIVVPTLTLIVYLTGINQHRTLYLNSILSTTILSIVLFLFIFIGLEGVCTSDAYYLPYSDTGLFALQACSVEGRAGQTLSTANSKLSK